MKCKEQGKMIFLLLLIAGAASVPLMTDCVSGEGAFLVSMSRIQAICQNVGRVFPVRIIPMTSLEYGCEAASFQSDVFYLIPALLGLSGLSLDTAYKLTLFLASAATAAAGYLCFGKRYGRSVGLAGSALYTWCPYRLNEMYRGGDLGEVIGWIFLPIVVSGMEQLCRMDRKTREYRMLWVKLGFTFSLLLLASMPLFVVTAATFLLCFLLMGRRLWHKEPLLVLGKAAGMVCLLDAWFLAPAFLMLREQGSVLVSEDFASRAVYLSQYFSAFFFGGRNASVEGGLQDAQALCPGMAVMLLILFYLWSLFTGRYGREEEDQVGRRMTLLSLALMLLSSTLFPWKVLSWKIFYDGSRTAAVIAYLFRTPAKWGAPACAVLVGLACFVLHRAGEKEKKVFNAYLLFAVGGVSFGTTQFFLKNLVKAGKAAAEGEEALAWIPFQVLAREPYGWRVWELLSAVALCAALAAGIVVLRKKRRQDA